MPDAPKRILVIDDEPDAVKGTAAVLEAGGYAVASARDGEAGLAAARKLQPDLILLDVQMPGKNGFEVFTELRADPALRNVPVVFVTGIGEKTGIHLSASDVGGFLGDQPDACVEKPVDPELLLATVRKVFRT
ncbi:MAG: response regulator [Planctomycetota bacterium]